MKINKLILIILTLSFHSISYANKTIHVSIVHDKKDNIQGKRFSLADTKIIDESSQKIAPPKKDDQISSFNLKNHESGIVSLLLGMTLLGSEWVLWLLIILSIVSIAIIIERVQFFMNNKMDFSSFMIDVENLLEKKDYEKCATLCAKFPERLETGVLQNGINARSLNPPAIEKSINSYISSQKNNLEKGLSFLGTLGNNAPFIGLFGTVLGIIQAFEKLGENPAGGVSVVMSGISEALVATAVGLFVAIPAVIAFNEFHKLLTFRYNQADSLKDLMIKHLS